ncbi:NADPH-dependent FMN reductase [Streptomonospora nanhaiensis]|uniref:FMN reductase n=1 Tax=Streptomonospora nanhaiensis TaxID=1323731 RepID=A0A853BKK9_9ACTN|nr:NAD(P)H-dependent oxidoreductase [Streptomonospora nanhaiensis]MBV2362132.1 NAD(P)H-dependent oxidoreductase [Streptomonospora nanhaiensis]MBV2364796.1 NAD(P)H-dependent oxidoreductase [Streptomonospora nanhaiensis]MBX9391559.1 NAD(P)H-dependent oxidoreductase [Streptomonospora nanhaiensis]NYI96038.1 FMN reductase [Streptomonospora nanhaiensis]
MTRFTVLVAAPEPRSAVRGAAVLAADTVAALVDSRAPQAPAGTPGAAAAPARPEAASAAPAAVRAEPTRVVDLAELGPALLAARPGRDVLDALEAVRRSDVLLVASPQAHGSYTGLLKVFLDRLPELGLGHGVAVPVAVVEDLRNGRTIEDDLRVLLADLGAWVVEPGLLISRRELERPLGVVPAWAHVAAPALAQALAVRV